MAITTRNINLSGLNNKVKLVVTDPKYIMSFDDWNRLVNAVIEAQNNIGQLDNVTTATERSLAKKIKARTAAKLCIFTESTKGTATSSFVAEEGNAQGYGFYETAAITLPAGKTIMYQECSAGTDGNFCVKYYDEDWADYVLTDDEFFTNDTDSSITVKIFRDGSTSATAYQSDSALNPGVITYRIGTLVSSQIGNINSILETINGNS